MADDINLFDENVNKMNRGTLRSW